MTERRDVMKMVLGLGYCITPHCNSSGGTGTAVAFNTYGLVCSKY